ncbi:MAG: alpha/beta hydrolase-fold protein [Bacteroidia bacterium]
MKAFLIIVVLVLSISIIFKSKPVNNSEDPLHYLVREPKIKSVKPPVIILLHGIGSNEKDLFSFANQLPDNFLVISVRAPFIIGNDSYAWYQADFSTNKPIFDKVQETKSRSALIKFITQLKTNYSFNEKNLFLCGFSQGAIMAYSIGLTRPDIVKGIAVMSGIILEEIKPSVASNEKLKGLAVFITHGTNDPILGINYAREALSYLKSKGIDPTYNEYKEVHTINNQMLNDLITWLNKK